MLGKVFNEITFTGQVPSLAGIVDRIEELGGLSVSIADKSNSDRSFRASLSLPELARNKLEIYAEIRSKSNAIDSSLAPDTPSSIVHIQMDAIPEQTLFILTISALESLGGCPKYPIAVEDKQQFLTNLTSAEITQRSYRASLLISAYWILSVISLLFLIPYWIICSTIFYNRVEDVRNNPGRYLTD
jgi:hypothetical protein